MYSSKAMGRNSKLLLVVVAVAAVLALFGLCSGEEEVDSGPGYSEGTIELGEIVASVSATGTVNPLVTVLVGSQASGTIESLHVDFNSVVKKGDLIAEIEPSLIRARLSQAEADRDSAEASLDKARVSVADTQRQLDRLLKLKANNVASESKLDAARYAHEVAVVETRLAQASLGQRNAALEQAQVNLAHTKIYAPIDGVVVSRDVDAGQTVAASLQAPTLFTIAQDLAQMQIEADVDEAFIGQIKEAQPVTFRVFAYPDRVFSGRLAQVRLNPKVEAGVVKYNCIIHVENADLALKPGMTATVTIEVGRYPDVLKVPNSALRFVPKPLPESGQMLRAELKRGEVILWEIDGDELKPFKVVPGLVGESETQVSGESIEEGIAIALPKTATPFKRKPRHGFGLF